MGRKQTKAAAAKATGTAAKAESPRQAKRTATSGKRGSRASNGTPPGPTATPPNLDTLRVSCLLNAQYHASREAFLDFVHRWFMFAIILLGAGAVTEMLGDREWIRNVIGITIAALGALDLTFDLSNRARTHSLMKRKYFELLADVQDALKSKSVAEACLNRFSADEEPAYHALVKLSWNAAQEMVYGERGEAYKVPAVHRFLKNICRFASSNYSLKDPPASLRLE